MAVVPSNPLRLAQEDLESIIERALEEARARGASQAEAAVSQDTGLSVGVRLGEVETLEHQRDRSMGITVYFGQRKGSASTADFSLDAVRATVAKACSIARFTAEDACAGSGGCRADGALAARPGSGASLERERGPRHRDRQIVRGSSAGVRPAHQQLRGRIGQHPSGAARLWQYARLRRRLSDHLAHLELRGARGHRGGHAARLLVLEFARLARPARSAEAIGRESARRTIARLGPRKLSTRRAPVLFIPEMARGLIGHFVAAIRGSSQYRQSSFLLNCGRAAGVSGGLFDRRATAYSRSDGQRSVR